MPLNVHISKINATSATARWNSPSKPNGNITFYQIKYGFVGDVAAKYIIVAASVHEIAIVQLRAFSSYHVQIRAATNSSSVLNWGNYSNTLHFQTSDGGSYFMYFCLTLGIFYQCNFSKDFPWFTRDQIV